MADEPTPPEDDEDEDDIEELTSCCAYRRKILVGILRVLTEEECGVPDSELADVILFDASSPSGKMVLAFRYCPWCGKPRDEASESRITDVLAPPPDAPDEEPPAEG